MARPGTIAADVEDFLRRRGDGADIDEIATALGAVRRSPVLRHSVRSAIYQNLADRSRGPFVRLERGRYGLKG